MSIPLIPYTNTSPVTAKLQLQVNMAGSSAFNYKAAGHFIPSHKKTLRNRISCSPKYSDDSSFCWKKNFTLNVVYAFGQMYGFQLDSLSFVNIRISYFEIMIYVAIDKASNKCSDNFPVVNFSFLNDIPMFLS